MVYQWFANELYCVNGGFSISINVDLQEGRFFFHGNFVFCLQRCETKTRLSLRDLSACPNWKQQSVKNDLSWHIMAKALAAKGH